MQVITSQAIADLMGVQVTPNLLSFHEGLKIRGAKAGLTRLDRLAACLAQVGHESASFRYDQEIWGPTAAQKRYDTRTDLGNTPEIDGDGELYKGRGPMQVTGRANYCAFRDWCRTVIDPKAPDFEKTPELLNTDPWEGLSVLWFWETNNLNRFVDLSDFNGLSRRINGGVNGLADRRRRFSFIGLRLLGSPNLRSFQNNQGLLSDGVFGPETEAYLFKALRSKPHVSFPAPPVTHQPKASFWAWFEALFLQGQAKG